MTSKRWFSWVFVLLLVFAQQQALLHPYQHTAELQGSSSSSDKKVPNPESCAKCVALADIGSAIGSQAQLFQGLVAGFERLAFSLPAFVAFVFLPYHSRAPPDLA